MALGSPIPFGEFSPDSPHDTPGVLLDVDGFYGSAGGLKALPSFVVQDAPALPLPVLGAYSTALPNDTRFTIVGTAEHLYALQDSVWIEFDGHQTFHTTTRWSFATWGSDMLAVNGVDPPQVSRNGAPFRPLRDFRSDKADPNGFDPPIASLVCVVDVGIFFVLAETQTDARLIGRGDTVVFSLSDTLWTPGIQNAVVSIALTGTVGPITGMKRIRGGVVAYKTKSLYFGYFTAPPFFWQFTSVSENVGAPGGQDSIINTGDVHCFPALDDFYKFDGSSLAPIPNMLKQWFYKTVEPSGPTCCGFMDEEDLVRMKGRFDRASSLAIWLFPSSDMGPETNEGDEANEPLDTELILNVRTGKWTKATPRDETGQPLTIETVVEPIYHIENAMTYAAFAALYPTYDSFPAGLTYGDPSFIGTRSTMPAVITSGHQLAVRTGAPTGGTILTGEIGDGKAFYQLGRVRPIFSKWPVDNQGLLQAYFRRVNGFPIPDPNPFPQPGVGPQAWLMLDGNFSLIQVARSHQLLLTFTADVEINGLILDLEFAGLE